MSKSEYDEYLKWSGKWLLIWLGLAFVFYLVAMETDFPEKSHRESLLDSISYNEFEIFKAIDDLKIFDEEEEMMKIEMAIEKVAILRIEAQDIWDSIHYGEVISRDGVGGYRAVGKNRIVVEKRDSAKMIIGRIKNMMLNLARNHGHVLDGTRYENLWQKNTSLNEKLDELYNRNARYYKSKWSNALPIIHHIFHGLTMLFIAIAIFIGIGALFEILNNI